MIKKFSVSAYGLQYGVTHACTRTFVDTVENNCSSCIRLQLADY